jgi:hypothetical protein
LPRPPLMDPRRHIRSARSSASPSLLRLPLGWLQSPALDCLSLSERLIEMFLSRPERLEALDSSISDAIGLSAMVCVNVERSGTHNEQSRGQHDHEADAGACEHSVWTPCCARPGIFPAELERGGPGRGSLATYEPAGSGIGGRSLAGRGTSVLAVSEPRRRAACVNRTG